MRSHPLLEHIQHRPYPAPAHSWVMEQRWFDLLFMHWPVDVNALRELIPRAYDIDTFDKTAWVGVVPFAMSNIHFKSLPPVPWLSSFLELNVRTYVKYKGKSGVYFFSLDAANVVAVEVARFWYLLPYFYARMSKRVEGDLIHYKSDRMDRRGKVGSFDATYRPVGQPVMSTHGSLEAWLTERYCLFTNKRNGDPLIGEIHHVQWPLQSAECEIRVNTMAEVAGVKLPSNTAPLLHFARELETIEWPIGALAAV